MDTKRTIAAFDFDETLITKDSLLDFARYSINLPTFLFKAGLFIPTLVEFKLKRITNQVTKERFLKLFFGGLSREAFNILGQNYIKRLNNITNLNAIEKLTWHKQQGHTVIIVSASISNWIKPWAAQYGVDKIISSEVQFENNKLTGKLNGKNCHGPEKPKQFLKIFPDRKSYILFVYGDGKSDKEMFKLADIFYEKAFN